MILFYWVITFSERPVKKTSFSEGHALTHYEANHKIDLIGTEKSTLKTDFIDLKNRIYGSYTDFMAVMPTLTNFSKALSK